MIHAHIILYYIIYHIILNVYISTYSAPVPSDILRPGAKKIWSPLKGPNHEKYVRDPHELTLLVIHHNISFYLNI